MNPRKKGQAALIDVLIFAMAVAIGISFLQVYAASHQDTSARDITLLAQQQYAQSALDSFAYVTAGSSADYETVQAQTLTNTSTQDLESLAEAAREAGAQIDSFDREIETLKKNISALNESELREYLASAKSNISAVRSQIYSATSFLYSLSSACEDVSASINAYCSLFSAACITGSPCSSVSTLQGDIASSASAVDASLSSLESDIDALDSQLESLGSEKEEVLDLLEDIQCVLREAGGEIDELLTYVEFGVVEDITVVDLLPVQAKLGTKTIDELLAESMYVEDRLAETDLLRSSATLGIRAYMQASEMNLSDPDNQIAQAAVLTLIRKDYREISRSSAKRVLDRTLSEKGYAYCVSTENCCDRIEEGACASIPDDAVHAVKYLSAIDGEKLTLSLYIWRK